MTSNSTLSRPKNPLLHFFPLFPAVLLKLAQVQVAYACPPLLALLGSWAVTSLRHTSRFGEILTTYVRR